MSIGSASSDGFNNKVPSNLIKLVPLRLDDKEEGIYFFDLVSRNIVREGVVVSGEFKHLEGRGMKVHFDLGPVDLPGSGETLPLNGDVHLASGWEVPTGGLEDGCLWAKCEEDLKHIFEDCGIQDQLFQSNNPYLFARLLLPPSVEMTEENAAPLLLYTCLGASLDDFTEARGGDPSALIQIAKSVNAILRGEREGVKEITSDPKFVSLLFMAQATRQSWMRAIKDHEALENVIASYTEWVDAVCWDGMKWSGATNNGSYEWGFATWLRRYFTVGHSTGKDMLGYFIGGIKVPPEVRADPLWTYYQTLYGTLGALYNEIISLGKEVKEDHGENIFMKKSLSKPPNGAGRTLHKILESRIPFILAEGRAIKPRFLLKYPKHFQELEVLFKAAESLADAGFTSGLVVERYTQHWPKEAQISVEFG